VIVTHGSIAVMVRHLTGLGLQAGSFDTEYGDDDAQADALAAQEPAKTPDEAT
jgi:putative mRNA 3-end processing factor